MSLRQTLAGLPREVRDTLFLLAVIAWVIAPQVPYLPGWTSAFAAGVLLWRGLLTWQGRPLPGRWLTGALLVLAVGLTLATFRTIVGREAGVTLIVVLLALKTLELRARRDAMVVFFLGFFTLLSCFFVSQSLATAAAMLVALLGLLTALVNAHLPVGRPPLALSLRMAARLMLLGAPIMLALFLLFPRMAPLWGMPGDEARGRSGLSNEMSIGQVCQPGAGRGRGAARALRHAGPPAAAAVAAVLPRPGAFGVRRAPLVGPGHAARRRRGPRRLRRAAARAAAGRGRCRALRSHAGTPPPQLAADAGRHAGAARAARRHPRLHVADLSWQASRPLTELLRYRAESHPRFRHGPLQYTRQLQPYLQLPPGLNPRTRALAAQMRADPALAAGGTPAYVQAALERLRTGGYVYTLEPGVYGQDTADAFWFDVKAGFCEHIASAFVVLMRALDVPARIVTGYQGGEFNGFDDAWTVRQSDAHAWAEVWQAGQGWVRVDPTGAVSPARIGALQRLQAPRGAFGSAMDAVIAPGLVQTLRAAWEAVNGRWNQWVLNYTQARQFDLLRALGVQSPDWQDLGRLLAGLMAAAALGGTAWAAWQRRRQDPWLRLLENARRRLARAGLALPAHLPPRAMAERARAHFGPDAAAGCADWLLRMENARYAAHPAETLADLQRRLRGLRWPAARPDTPR